MRAELDARSETLGYRVRAAEMQKIPVMRSWSASASKPRAASASGRREELRAQEVMPLEQFEKNIQEEIRTRGIS